MASSGATTSISWHDPYGPTPQPKVGREMILETLTKRTDSYGVAISNAERLIAQSELPDEFKGILTGYFGMRAARMGEQILRLSRPEEEVMAEMLARDLEERKLRMQHPGALP